MRIHFGTDHAGFELKEHLRAVASRLGHEVVDHGALAYDPQDDYPAFCFAAAGGVVADRAAGVAALAVVIGGSGNGEQIAANKVRGARAALAWSLETARLARQHNDANVLAIGARQHTVDEATAFFEAFVAEPFSEDPRHVRRIDEVAAFERR